MPVAVATKANQKYVGSAAPNQEKQSHPHQIPLGECPHPGASYPASFDEISH